MPIALGPDPPQSFKDGIMQRCNESWRPLGLIPPGSSGKTSAASACASGRKGKSQRDAGSQVHWRRFGTSGTNNRVCKGIRETTITPVVHVQLIRRQELFEAEIVVVRTA